jgi:hypothetical protein
MNNGDDVTVNGRPGIYVGTNGSGQCLVRFYDGVNLGPPEVVDCASIVPSRQLEVGQQVFLTQPLTVVQVHSDGTYSATFAANSKYRTQRFHPKDLRAPSQPGPGSGSKPKAARPKKKQGGKKSKGS